VFSLPGWTTKALAGMASRLFGSKNLNQPFSLGRLALSARRVLVIPPSGLAEMLLLYPALTLLRAALPESRIICLVDDGQGEVLRGDRVVDDLVELPQLSGVRGLWQFRAFVAEMRDRMVEAVFYFDFRHDLYRILLPILSGARLRLTLQGEIGYPLFNVEVVPSQDSSYFRDLNLCLVRFLSQRQNQWRSWQLPEKEVKIAREIVRFRKPNQTDLLVGVDLSYTKSGDRPPFEVAIRLAKSFEALRPSRIALLSDPAPAITDEEIRRLGTSDWLDIPRKSFRDTLGILSQCDLLVTGNGNLMHFAVAMGVPAFILLSEQDDRRWVPTSGEFRVVQEEIWSSTPPAKLAMQMRDFVCASSRV
jgi:ADP-heptose:LPS heptosyltransferase